MTRQFFSNRFDNARRDVVKKLVIKEVKHFETKRLAEPLIRYRIESKSWPNYKPYLRKGKKFQRRVPHRYDVILQLDELSINTSAWKGRLGSGRKWNPRPPQNKIKSIYRETRKKWEKQSLKKGKTKKAQKQWLKEKIEKHKKSAMYLDVGDFNSRINGINADFVFRFAYAWSSHNHLYGQTYGYRVPANKTNRLNIVAFPKHMINIIELLMRRGILKNN